MLNKRTLQILVDKCMVAHGWKAVYGMSVSNIFVDGIYSQWEKHAVVQIKYKKEDYDITPLIQCLIYDTNLYLVVPKQSLVYYDRLSYIADIGLIIYDDAKLEMHSSSNRPALELTPLPLGNTPYTVIKRVPTKEEINQVIESLKGTYYTPQMLASFLRQKGYRITREVEDELRKRSPSENIATG